MTREELEAVIRAQLTRVTSNALQAGVPSTGIMNRATETILAAADAYMVTECRLTAERRAAHAPAWTTTGAPAGAATHYTRDGRRSASACGHRTSSRQAPWMATADPAKVTCGACKRTGAWRAALREAS